VGKLLNINQEEVVKLKIFSLDFINSINKNVYENKSNKHKTLASSRANKKVTVIDFENTTAVTYKSPKELRSTLTFLTVSTLLTYLDKNLVINKRYLFKSGFIEGITTEYGEPVTLTSDQIVMLKKGTSFK
jgi:hypothetical protein